MERRDSKGPRHIRDVLRAVLRERGGRRSKADEDVFGAWRVAAGRDWGAWATPVSFRAGQLTVEVVSAVHLMELKNYRAESYRERANATLGQDRIRKVVVKLKD